MGSNDKSKTTGNFVKDYNNATHTERVRFERNRQIAQSSTLEAIVERNRQEKERKRLEEEKKEAEWQAKTEKFEATMEANREKREEEEYRNMMLSMQERLMYDQLSPEGKAQYDAEKKAEAERIAAKEAKAAEVQAEVERRWQAEQAKEQKERELKYQRMHEELVKKGRIALGIKWLFLTPVLGFLAFTLVGVLTAPLIGLIAFAATIIIIIVQKPWRSNAVEAKAAAAVQQKRNEYDRYMNTAEMIIARHHRFEAEVGLELMRREGEKGR